MAITLVTSLVKHERRLRLFFDHALAAGAFTNLALYQITSADGGAANPPVVALFSVTNSPNVVELHLGADLVQGAAYLASAIGVPATDSSVTPSGSVVSFRIGAERAGADLGTPRPASDLARRLYGEDLRHDGRDWVEGPDGDLATDMGIPVVRADLRRVLTSNGLPWRPSFGAHAREFVDAPAPMLARVPARALAQVLQDDRVQSADAEVVGDSPEAAFVEVRPVLIGAKLLSGIGAVRAKIQ